jgi:hypothetical protein
LRRKRLVSPIQKKVDEVHEKDNDDFRDEAILCHGSETIGYTLLRRLGWDAAHALGKDGDLPINDPISVTNRPKRSGLGNC